MTELQFNNLNNSQKKMVAVAFLMDKPELRPDTTVRFFNKLLAYEGSAVQIDKAMRQAQKSIQDLRKQLDQIVGSINAVSGLIAEELPDENLKEWCMQFELDENGSVPVKNQKVNEAPDIAGSTARNIKSPILLAK